MHENRGGGEGGFEGVEGFLGLFVPCKGMVFPGEMCEAVGDKGEATNKVSIKVGKPKQGLNVFDTSRGVPFLDCFDFWRGPY